MRSAKGRSPWHRRRGVFCRGPRRVGREQGRGRWGWVGGRLKANTPNRALIAGPNPFPSKRPLELLDPSLEHVNPRHRGRYVADPLEAYSIGFTFGCGVGAACSRCGSQGSGDGGGAAFYTAPATGRTADLKKKIGCKKMLSYPRTLDGLARVTFFLKIYTLSGCIGFPSFLSLSRNRPLPPINVTRYIRDLEVSLESCRGTFDVEKTK